MNCHSLILMNLCISLASSYNGNQQQPLVSTWTTEQLATLLDHPQLNHQQTINYQMLHTISFEEILDGPPRRRRRKLRPKHRSDLNPLEPIASHRYLKYDAVKRQVGDNSEGGDAALSEIHQSLDSSLDPSDASDTNPATEDNDDADNLPSFMEPKDQSEETDAPIYQPIRIHFDASELFEWKSSGDEHTEARVDYLVNKVLPGLAAIWSSALTVVPVQDSLVVDYAWCPFGQPTNQAFTRGMEETDLVVFVTANSAQCENQVNKVVLASATACYWDQYERPVAGNIDFCLDVMNSTHLVSMGESIELADEEVLMPEFNLEGDPAKDHMLQMAIATSVHEFSHLLGVTPHDLVFFHDQETGAMRTPEPQQKMVECVSGQRESVLLPDENTLRQAKDRHGKVYYEVTLPTVKQIVQNHFNCPTLTGARLENQDDDSHCFGSHFEERLFFRGANTNYVPEILSPLTLAMLQDSGWYLPNYRVAKVKAFGHGAGCDFVDQDCIQNGDVADFGDAFFCTEKATLSDETFTGEYGCDPSYSGIGICDLVDYSEIGGNSPPKMYQYFSNKPTLGALMATADYCPTYTIATASCREISSFPAGTLSALPDAVQQLESNSHHAKCFPTVGADRPICLDVVCDTKHQVIKVKIGDDVLVCNHANEAMNVPGTDLQIKCPPMAIVCPESICPANCAGNGVCDFTRRSCNCNDSSDKSAGCFDTVSTTPPQYIRGWEVSSATHLLTNYVALVMALTSLFYLLG